MAALYAKIVKVAALDGNLPVLKEAETASGMDLRQVTGIKGRNLLHLAVMGACATGRLDVCRYLVEEKGFDANATSTEGETTILVATDTHWVLNTEYGSPGVVPLLTYFLGRGVDPVVPDASGRTPLLNAAGHGYNEAIVLLLSKGIPVDPLSHKGTPLLMAAKMGHAQTVKILLQHGADAGADVNFQPPGMTMALAAVGSCSADIVNFLLEAGVDPNIHDGYGRFPIMQAAVHERHELVEILLPRTNPIPSLADWSVGGIICTTKTLPRNQLLMRSQEGKEAFANGDYGYAKYCFLQASCIDPYDATLEANLSLCCLKLREGMSAVKHAQQCQRLRPRWAKAWFREGAALSLLQKHGAAVAAFQEALKLDPANAEIENKLRDANEALSKCH